MQMLHGNEQKMDRYLVSLVQPQRRGVAAARKVTEYQSNKTICFTLRSTRARRTSIVKGYSYQLSRTDDGEEEATPFILASPVQLGRVYPRGSITGEKKMLGVQRGEHLFFGGK